MKMTGIYIVAVFTAGISLLGLMLLPPVLPWMIAPLAATESNIGLLMSAFTLPQIFVSPLIGMFTDRFGRKKVLFPSLIIFSLSGIAITLANSLPLALTFRFCQGVVGAGFYPLATTLIGDLYQGEERQHANGTMSAFVNLVGIVIPAVGGYMALIDWRTPFLLFSSGIVVAALVWKYIPEDSGTKTSLEKGSSVSTWTLFRQSFALMKKQRLALTTFASMVLFGVNISCLITYYPIFAQQYLEATQDMIGIAQAITFTASMLTSLLYGRIAKHLRVSYIGIISFTIYASGVMFIPLSSSYLTSILPLIILGFGFGLAIPLVNNEMLEATPPEIRATEASLYQSMTRVGQTISPIFFGIFLAFTDRLDWIFWIGGLAMFSITLLYLINLFRKRIE